MATHYRVKGSLQDPNPLCNYPGRGSITEDIDKADCKRCLKSAESLPVQERQRFHKVGLKREIHNNSAIMTGQRKEK